MFQFVSSFLVLADIKHCSCRNTSRFFVSSFRFEKLDFSNKRWVFVRINAFPEVILHTLYLIKPASLRTARTKADADLDNLPRYIPGFTELLMCPILGPQ